MFHIVSVVAAINLATKKANTCEGFHRQTFNMRHTLVGNTLVDHADVVGVSPVGAAPTSFTTLQLASMDWAMTTATRNENHLSFGIW